MKFKTYKAAKNYLIARIEKMGIDVRDINVDMLVYNSFKGSGTGANFELELQPLSNTFSATLQALRVPRRGTVCDECWEAAVRRLGAYMEVHYTAKGADALARDVKEYALFTQHIAEEAL